MLLGLLKNYLLYETFRFITAFPGLLWIPLLLVLPLIHGLDGYANMAEEFRNAYVFSLCSQQCGIGTVFFLIRLRLSDQSFFFIV